MIKLARMWMIGASAALWLVALPAQANELGDLVRSGDVAAVTSALDKGAAIDEIDGVTALYIACETGNAALAELLITRGADVNLPSAGKERRSTPPPRPALPTSSSCCSAMAPIPTSWRKRRPRCMSRPRPAALPA